MKKDARLLLYAVFAAYAVISGCGSVPSTTTLPLTPSPPLPKPSPTTISMTPSVPPLEPSPTPGKTIVVASAADSGPGTLRQALEVAQPGDTITFDPTVFPPDAPETISVASGLPGLGQGLSIDASDAGVILDGAQLPRDSWIAGLEIVSDGNTIRGMQVINFTGTGIVVAGGKYNTIGGDRNIGMGPIGQGNLASGNDYGIGLWDYSSNNIITGNLVGTDARGTQAFGNHVYGFWINEGAHENVIGPENVIAYNGGPGIDLDGSQTVRNTITQNTIHDNGREGMLLWEGAHENVIGPGNVIANNAGPGIDVNGSETVRNTITQNSIHDNGRTGILLWEGGNQQLAAPIFSDFDMQARTFAGVTCANCMVEFFSDENDEGVIYEGQTVADSTGLFTFSSEAPFIGPQLTATATDMDGNTSEFSIPITGATRSLVLQGGNDLPWAILETKRSSELEDNRIGTLFSEFSDEEGFDFLLYSQGIKRARVAINWIEVAGMDWSMPELSISPGQDDVFTRLADNGFVITYVLSFWDKATYPEGVGAPCPRFKTEEDIQRYLEFVRFIVSHFKDRVQIYEVWNEPDNRECPQWIEVEDYINLVQRVVPVIQQEYPEAKIQVGGTSGLTEPSSEAYLFRILESDIMPLVDIVSWHPFYGNSPQYDAEYYYAYPAMVQEIKEVAAAHGFGGEYEADEILWRTTENTLPDNPWTYSSTVAAKYHARGILMHLGMDVDVSTGAEYYYQIPSIVHVIRNLSTIMAGARPESLPIQVQSTATNIVSYTFALPDGDILIALWKDSVAVDDDPGMNTTLTFPDSSAQRVIGIDVLHGFEQQLVSEQDGTGLILRDLLVKDYPIILRLTD